MSYARNLARLARAGAPIVDNLQAIRDLTIYDTLYPLGVIARGHTTPGDGGGGYFNIITGQTPGHFTDDDITTAIFTGGDGSAAAVRESPDKEFHSDWAAPPKDGVTDAWPKLNAAFIAFLDQLDTGCNVFVVDACAAGYVTSKAFYAIGYGGYTIRFEASITSTATLTDLPARTTGDLFYLGGDTGAYVDAINLELGPGVVLDGGGSGITNYTYSTGHTNGNYAVAINYTDDPTITGCEITNGLVNTVVFFGCRRPKISHSLITGSIHDNGLQFTNDPEDYDDADPATWSNGLAYNCVASNNEDYGIATWNCNGVIYDNCTASNNGAETSPHGTGGGHAGGGMSCERSSAVDARSRVKMINCMVGPNLAKGIGVTGEAEIVNTEVFGVTLGATGTDVWDGSGIAVIGGSVKVAGGSVHDNVKHGIYPIAHATRGYIQNFVVSGGCEIYNNQRAIFCQGIVYANIDSSVRCHNNSNDPIRFDNTSGENDYNEGGGQVYCSATVTFVRSERAAEAENVGYVNFSNMAVNRANTIVYNRPPLLFTSCTQCVATNNTFATESGGVLPTWLVELAGDGIDSLVAWSNYGDQGGGFAVTGLVPGTRPAQAPIGFADSVGMLDDNTGGTITGSLTAVAGSGDDADINRNFASLNAKLDNLLGKLAEGGTLGTTPWEVVDP